MRPRRLKLGTHVDSGQLYHVNQNQAAAAYLSLYFFIFLSLQFSTLIFLVTLFSGTVRPRRLKICGQWADVSCIPESGCCCLFIPLFLHFSFSPIFNIEIFVTLFSRTVRPRRLKLDTHVNSGQMYLYTGIRLLLLIHPLFLHFLSLQFSNIKIFRHTYIRNCEA